MHRICPWMPAVLCAALCAALLLGAERLGAQQRAASALDPPGALTLAAALARPAPHPAAASMRFAPTAAPGLWGQWAAGDVAGPLSPPPDRPTAPRSRWDVAATGAVVGAAVGVGVALFRCSRIAESGYTGMCAITLSMYYAFPGALVGALVALLVTPVEPPSGGTP